MTSGKTADLEPMTVPMMVGTRMKTVSVVMVTRMMIMMVPWMTLIQMTTTSLNVQMMMVIPVMIVQMGAMA